MAPAKGCVIPHISCATAKARLIEAMPRPVALFSGLMNSACDWRTPKTSANTSAAAAMIHHCWRSNRMQQLLDQSVQRGEAPVTRLRAQARSEEHTSELQSRLHLVCRLLLEKKKNNTSDEC